MKNRNKREKKGVLQKKGSSGNKGVGVISSKDKE
jgi:hypothetical protein